MACTTCKDPCGEEICVECDDCACDNIISTECIIHKKGDLPCVGNIQGDKLEDILENIDAKLCSVTSGADGLSAYEVAVSQGYSGTVSEWLTSLEGTDGSSAYEIAVSNGFVGSEAEWLASLEGVDGITVSNQVFYQELDSYTFVNNNWSNLRVLPTTGFEVVTGFSHTVAEGGTYEVLFQSTSSFLGAASDQGLACTILVNSVPESVTLTADTFNTASGSYKPISLYKNNLVLTAGQTIELGVIAGFVNDPDTPAEPSLINSKIVIRKIP
jgi:hypothetical protein